MPFNEQSITQKILNIKNTLEYYVELKIMSKKCWVKKLLYYYIIVNNLK